MPSNSGKAGASRFRQGAKGSTSTRNPVPVPVDELARRFSEEVELQPTKFQFDADSGHAEKERMAQLIWREDLLVDAEAGTLRAGNSELVKLLVLLTQNTYGVVVERKEAMWQEAVLSNMTRIKSQKMHTLVALRISIEALRVQLNRDFWQALHLFTPGLLVSHSTAEEFVGLISKLRPGPKYEVLLGVGCVMFDNYTRNRCSTPAFTPRTLGVSDWT